MKGLTQNIDWMHMRHHKEQSRRSRDNEPSQNENSALTQLFPKPHDMENTSFSSCLHLAAHNLMRCIIEIHQEGRVNTDNIQKNRQHAGTIQSHGN